MKAPVPDKLSVRAARPGDEAELVRCCSQMDHRERRLEPRKRPGDHIPAVYIKSLRRHAGEHGGCIMVAEVDGRVAGFVYAFQTEVLDHQTNEPALLVSISDLVVARKFSKLGVDRMLIDAAEQYARQQGADALTVAIQSGHKPTLNFYADGGYKPHELIMMKNLK
jgi:GNAT superfamily N-acetyltransferase